MSRVWPGLPDGAWVGERYRVLTLLARGAFGLVYAAEQVLTGRRVALKVLWPYATGARVERLLGEARLVSGVQSRHVVQVLDAGIDAATGSVFIAMELLTGATLAQHVAQGGPLTAASCAALIAQIATGLGKLHEHVTAEGLSAPIVHRDLKPENLFLTHQDDGQPLVKILDFGTAKLLGAGVDSSGVLAGTPCYMAAEQLRGSTLTPAADIWALGLVAFYLRTGHCYWRAASGGDREQLFAEVLNLPLAPASERALQLGASVELEPAFDGWFSRCVERDVTRRFPSAASASAALQVSSAMSAFGTSAGSVDSRVQGPPRSHADDFTRPARRRTSALRWLLVALVAGAAPFWLREPAARSPVLPASPAALTPALDAVSGTVEQNVPVLDVRGPSEQTDVESHDESRDALAPPVTVRTEAAVRRRVLPSERASAGTRSPAVRRVPAAGLASVYDER